MVATPSQRTARRLPIDQHEDEIKRSIRETQLTVIIGPPGCGKTRRVSLWSYQAGLRTIHALPRRLTARAAATTAARDSNTTLGVQVGYRTSMERSCGPKTRLTFVTDGLRLVQELFGESDPDMLILDEVHEWRLETEVLMARVREKMRRNPRMRVVIMSATIDPDRIARYFGTKNVRVIRVEMPECPVVEQEPGRTMLDDVVRLLGEGRNVLCFLPGKREIEAMIRDVTRSGVACVALPLHAELHPSEQDRVYRQYPVPMFVGATTIAQSSVTFDFDAAVDSGLERTSELGDDGVETLLLRTVSLADRTQRKGRPGRGERRGPEGPAVYIDHCPIAAEDRPEYAAPEILRVDLAQVYLRIACAGMRMEDMTFFHQPRARDIKRAREYLVLLGCLDTAGNVTPIGYRVARLPVSVHFGRMLIEAEKRGVIEAMIRIVAVGETRGIGDRRITRWRTLCGGERESDAIAQANVLAAAGHMDGPTRASYGINSVAFHRASEIQKRLKREFSAALRRQPPYNRDALIHSMCTGMVGRLFRRLEKQPEKKGERRYTSGTRVRRLSGTSVLSPSPEWLIGDPRDIQVRVAGKKKKRKVTVRTLSLATKVDLAQYQRANPHVVGRDDRARVRYSVAKDIVASRAETRIGSHVIESRWRRDPGHPMAPQVFAEWLAATTLGEGGSRNAAMTQVIADNRACLRRAAILNLRCDTPRFTEMSQVELTAWYLGKLAGARSVREVGNLDELRLPELDEEVVEQVLRESPSTVSLGRLELDVDYEVGPQPTVVLDFETPEGVAELHANLNGESKIRLDTGEDVHIRFSYGGSVRYEGTNLHELRRTLHRIEVGSVNGTERPSETSPRGVLEFEPPPRRVRRSSLLDDDPRERSGRRVDQY